jgi:hypothetical protein
MSALNDSCEPQANFTRGLSRRGAVLAGPSLALVIALVSSTFAQDQASSLSTPLKTSDFRKLRSSTLTVSPSLRPEFFVTCVDNRYFPLIPGTVYHQKETTEDGVEEVTVTVTNKVREILAIKATVIHDVARLDGEVKEDTYDWYAQDNRGNVWYLGEDTKEYENGKASTSGSWEAGVAGAKPGLAMLGEPRPGDMYYQEYAKGEAEDMGGVISMSEHVDVPQGSFDGVLKTGDYDPIDDQLENKWFAPGVGPVKTTTVVGSEHSELVSITHDRSAEAPDRNCGGGRSTP